MGAAAYATNVACVLLMPAAMYAIRIGSCAVIVDPRYKKEDNKLGSLEPGKTLRVSGQY